MTVGFTDAAVADLAIAIATTRSFAPPTSTKSGISLWLGHSSKNASLPTPETFSLLQPLGSGDLLRPPT